MTPDQEKQLLAWQEKWVADSDAMQMKQWSYLEHYANIVTLAGYAGIFAVWGFVHDKMPSRATAAVAILLTLSICTFVLFEVYKGARMSAEWHRHFHGRHDGLTHQQAIDLIQAAKRKSDQLDRKFAPIWQIAFTVALLLAVFAVVILLFALFAELLTL